MTQTGGPVAIVAGTGFGCRTHVPALRAAGFDVAALVGADSARTERRAAANGVALAFTDLGEAITRTGAVAVTVATPPHTHAALTLTALARGCHVICEKPFAKDAAEARVMLDAARRAGVTNLIGNEFRWSPGRALAARAIAEGAIGAPRFVTLVDYMPLVATAQAKMPSWWFDEQQGGGWLGAHGAHIIDQVRVWLGDFESLSAALPIVSDRQHGAEDSYLVRFRLANGAEGVVQQTAGAWGPMGSMARVAGTHGTLWLEGSAVWIADRNGSRQLDLPADLQLPQFAQMDLGPFTRLCEALRAGVEGREPSGAVPLPTFSEGVACMEVIDAIRASAAGGGAVVRVGLV